MEADCRRIRVAFFDILTDNQHMKKAISNRDTLMPAKNLKSPARSSASSYTKKKPGIKVKVIVHEAEEGGFWAEVPALPGCFTQAETRAELRANLRDAIEGCLLAGSGLPPAQEGLEEEIEL